MDRKEKLSLLWIFAIFNYIYADVFSIYVPETLKELMTGTVGGMQLTPIFLLAGAILMETAIAMVILSRILDYRANRRANIIVGAIHTLSVFASLFVGTPELYYIFFATIEMATTSFIVWLAWKWPISE